MKNGRECYNCGQEGQTARFCNESREKYYGKTETCYICHRQGHLARECNENSHRTIRCSRCQGFGHVERNCIAMTYHLQRTGATNSTEGYQSSSRPTKTKSRSLNSSYATTAPQRVSKITPGPSAQNVRTKQKNDVKSTSNRSNRVTKLETLANELFLGLFEYLSTAHLLSAFHGLNSRLETLLFVHSRVCHWDFRLVPKHDLKMICQRYLPLIMDRIISLRLSDHDYNLKQTNPLSSSGVIIRQFNNLRSLSLCHIRSEEVMNTMMVEWSHLPNLTHLKVIKCHSSFAHRYTTYLSNAIWRLPKLTHCCVDTEQYVFYMPTIISLSIEYVSIFGHCCRLNELTRLLTKTPRLRSLSVRHHDLNDDQYFSSPISSITVLKLYDIHSRPVMMNLLQTMTSLSHLSIETFYINLDGYQWEQIIIRHLPNLRIFRLKMEIQYTGKMNSEQQVDTLLDTFRSPFWLQEHQWFVRCHRRPQKDYSDILLYTLPLVFRDVNMSTIRSAYKSTCLDNKNH